MINHDKPLDLDRAPCFRNLAIFMDQGLEVEAELQEQEDAAFSAPMMTSGLLGQPWTVLLI